LIETIRLKNIEGVTFGIDSNIDLELGNSVLRDKILDQLMMQGVTVEDRNATYVDCDIKIGKNSVIMSNTHISGNSEIGKNSIIGPNSIICSSKIGNNCHIVSSNLNDSVICNSVSVGPFSNVRNNSYLDDDVHLGTSAEVNRSRLGKGTKSSHFSYIGDALVGHNVNIGAGTVTCNYDGKNKNKTIIGDDAFIGSDTMLIAPVKIGNKSSTGAGSVVTHDIDDESRVAGVPAKYITKPA
jgi:bifunctional UDP-N-acetylglucosamine pyrophosphorylase/glucosamine-1-phosphate N-acetyltransferase